MKLIYGIVGEGMGHATRSRVVLEHLLEAGHEVRCLVGVEPVESLGRSVLQERRETAPVQDVLDARLSCGAR